MNCAFVFVKPHANTPATQKVRARARPRARLLRRRNQRRRAQSHARPPVLPAPPQLVKDTLLKKGLAIKKEGEITAAQIDKNMLIDNHYCTS